MPELNATEGQAEAPPEGTTAEAPEGSGEQSANLEQTTADGTGPSEESFFDVKDIEHDPNLMSAYKQMQASFTKSKQSFADGRQKIEAYDQFSANPVATMEQLARQYGYSLVKGTAAPTDGAGEQWQPKTWDDVMERATTLADKKAEEKYSGMMNEVKGLKQKNVETFLDANYSDWRLHEDKMIENLSLYPAMANDPDALYRLSVPPELLKSRATKAALAQLTGSNESAQVSGTEKSRVTSHEPSGPLTIDQAVVVARQRLAKRGIKRPSG